VNSPSSWNSSSRRAVYTPPWCLFLSQNGFPDGEGASFFSSPPFAACPSLPSVNFSSRRRSPVRLHFRRGPPEGRRCFRRQASRAETSHRPFLKKLWALAHVVALLIALPVGIGRDRDCFFSRNRKKWRGPPFFFFLSRFCKERRSPLFSDLGGGLIKRCSPLRLYPFFLPE